MPVVGSAQASVDHRNVETKRKPRRLDAGQIVVGTGQDESRSSEGTKSQIGDFTIVRSPFCAGERRGEGSAKSRGLWAATVAAVKKYGPGKIGGFDSIGIDHNNPSRAQQAQILQNFIAKGAASYNQKCHAAERCSR